MSSMLYDYTTGLERLAREVTLILADKLNGEIAAQQSKWVTLDQQYASRLGQAYEETILEPIDPANLYDGHRPSLIGASIDRYPNLAVMAFDAENVEELSGDQFMAYRAALQIEAMVKAGPYTNDDTSGAGEGLVNRRIQRMVDAIVICLIQSRNLNGLALEVEHVPTVEIGNVFARREERSRGARFLWQGAVLTYAVTIPVPGY